MNKNNETEQLRNQLQDLLRERFEQMPDYMDKLKDVPLSEIHSSEDVQNMFVKLMTSQRIEEAAFLLRAYKEGRIEGVDPE